MKKQTQVFNPYLPPWEYIPDGEPHIFGEHLYIFGSHDMAEVKPAPQNMGVLNPKNGKKAETINAGYR